MEEIKRGVGICHYERVSNLSDIVAAVRKTVPRGTRVVVCDDGSAVAPKVDVPLFVGPNMGVAANKNRALWALQDCHYLCILEDDLIPTEEGWFEAYEKAAQLSGIHHFCRVQDKEIESTTPEFDHFMGENRISPVYGSSPRGDLTFLTSKVVRTVGAFNPVFRGAGYAHGEWSSRVARAGLINHPLRWLDIAEGRDKLIQVGDREGGRWNDSEAKLKRELQQNKQRLRELQRNEYTFHELVMA